MDGSTFSKPVSSRYEVLPAGDVLCILVEPGKVVPLISVAEHWSWLSGAKIDKKCRKASLFSSILRTLYD